MSTDSIRALDVIAARPEHADAIAAIIHRAFAARPDLDPPSTAMEETAQSVRAALETAGGLLVERRGVPMGALLFDESRPGLLGLRRVSVDPKIQARGVASAMVGVAEDIAEERGKDGLWLHVRAELPATVRFWQQRKYVQIGGEGTLLEFGKTLWLARETHSAADTQALAARLAALLRPGDLLVLSGDLGAGKTTFTQGLAEGLGVQGPVTSPTFVIAREHPPVRAGDDAIALVHVDAYRLGSAAELDDLDLDASAQDAVTVVEWGEGIAEQLNPNRIHIRFECRQARPGDPIGTRDAQGGDVDEAESRVITIKTHGPRWVGVPLRSALLGPSPR